MTSSGVIAEPPILAEAQERAAGADSPPASAAAWNVHTSLEVLEALYNYNHWLFNRVRPFIRGEVCEIGSGTGTITRFLLSHRRVVGVEPFEQSLRVARERFEAHLNVRFVRATLQSCPNEAVPAGTFDSVVCLNVLEHIEDDVHSLAIMRRLSKPRGRVVILVPAHMSLYGQLDVSFGHYRRYNRRSLGQAFAAAGLHVTHSWYMNAVGCIGWLWNARIRRCREIPFASARFFDRLVPFIDAFERVVPVPFGQSLVMIGTPEPVRQA